MSTPPQSSSDLKKTISQKRHEINMLEADLVALTETELKKDKKSLSTGSKNDEKTSLILLIISCIGMGIFVLSGWFMNPDQTRTSKPWIHISWPESAKKACSVNDGNYSACVDGQKQGSGCVWYASCNKCVSQNTSDISSACK
jgi:hypothetical protein